MKLSNKDYILLAIFVVIIIVAFFIGRNSSKSIEQVNLPDNSKYYKTIDSLKAAESLHKARVVVLESRIDSLNKAKVINKIIYIHDSKQIKSFTPTSRHNWNDSVLKRAGLK